MDLSQAWVSLQRMVNGLIASLPAIGVGLLVVAASFFVGRTIRRVVSRVSERRMRHRNLALALGRVAQGLTIVVGVLVAATIVLPTVGPGDLVQVLGLGGVAIGFAFKEIFQNYFAGILLLVNEPFRVGDQIVVDDYEGTVEEIEARATLIRTYYGRRVVIPNSDLYTKSVTVNTAFPIRRTDYDFGIGYGDDIERAKEVILQAIERADGVLPDPKADVIVVDFAESSVSVRARWWSDSRIPELLVAQDNVLAAVRRDLEANGIDLPFPTRQIIHDQSEESDGDRRRQREGWPAGARDVPRPRGAAVALGAIADAVGASSGGGVGHAGRRTE